VVVASNPAASSVPIFTVMPPAETTPAAAVTSVPPPGPAAASHLANGHGVTAVTAPRSVVRAR
jgi:hypothetical protein